MKPITDRLIAAGFGSALMLLSGIGASSYLSVQRLLADKQQVVQTYQVLSAIDRAVAAFATAEVGQQGYAIQGQQTYLKSGLAATQTVRYRLQTVQDLTENSPDHQQRLTEVEERINQRIVQLQIAILQQQEQPLDAAAIAQLSNSGREIKETTLRRLQAMRLEEYTLLQQRSEAIARSTRRIMGVMVVGLGFSLALLLATFLLLRKQMRTNRQLAEQALQLEQEAANLRLKTILESITDAFVSLDRSWHYTYVNQRAGQLFNRRPEDLLGKHIWTEFPEGVGQTFYHAYHRAAETGEPIQLEEFYAPWNRWFENRIYPSAEGLSIFFQDITVRKRAEIELERSEKRYRSLVVATAQVVWTLNPAGEVLGDVPSWRSLTGQSVAEMQGRGWLQAIPPDDRRRLQAAWQQASASKTLYEIEYRVRTADGSDRLFWARGMPILSNQHQIEEWIGTLTDITDRRRAEQELQQTNERLELKVQERTAELEQLNAELRRSNQDLEQFAYVASHDLREPLRAITGYTQLLMLDYGKQLDTTAQEYASYVIDGAQRMQQLIQDLLDYSRVGTCDLVPVPIDGEALLAQVLSQLQVAIAESQATIEHTPLPSFVADRTQLAQLFQNLISNAIKFRQDEPPHVRISAEAAQNEVKFAVRDHGIGIRARDLDRIFEVFRRLHTRQEFPGTGIGLAICKKIVDRHGGQIWAESTPGSGTTFYFTLPQPPPSDRT